MLSSFGNFGLGGAGAVVGLVFAGNLSFIFHEYLSISIYDIHIYVYVYVYVLRARWPSNCALFTNTASVYVALSKCLPPRHVPNRGIPYIAV